MATSGFWLFQANPDLFDLPGFLGAHGEGTEDDWPVPRYQAEIQDGDKVVFWCCGKKAGIYAHGEIISGLHARRPVKAPEANKPYRKYPFWIDVSYSHILAEPIFRPKLRAHPVLCDLMVLRAPQGTIFPVLPKEWTELQKLIGKSK